MTTVKWADDSCRSFNKIDRLDLSKLIKAFSGRQRYMKGKDILCVVDFSESSEDAMKWAFDVAARIKATVIVLYCYRLVAAMHDEETLSRKRKIEREATVKFREFQEQHLARHPGPYRFISEPGLPRFQVEMFLEKNPVGLLVLGSSVVQQFDEYESPHFEAFLVKSRIPVVVVPHQKHGVVKPLVHF